MSADVKSKTFAQKYDDNLPIPKLYRSSVQALEQLCTSSITLPQLQRKIADVHSNPKLPRFDHVVLDKVAHIERIASQLNEDIGAYPAIHFAPGALVDELNALIQKKEEELTESKSAQMNRSNVKLCEDFLHGRCGKGVTCTDSHTLQSLVAHLEQWIEEQMRVNSRETLTITDEFGPAAWEALVDIARKVDFTALVLRTVDRDALLIISKAISEGQFEAVTFLDLSKNGICEVFPRGTLKLAKALSLSDTITELSIGYNALGVSGSLALCQAVAAKGMITSLNLSGNGIVSNDPGFLHLCQALAMTPKLRKLSLAHNPIGADGLRKLLMAYSDCDDCELEFLDLFNTSMGDSGAAFLGEFMRKEATGRRLRYLNVSWNKISFDGIAALSAGLENHPSLEVLRAYYNHGIGRKGAMGISDFIKQSDVIASIDLRWTNIGDDGASTICDALSTNKSIREILMSGNDLDARTDLLLSEKMKKRTPVTPEGIVPIQRQEEVW